ncbi:MAG: helix-turn-helix domain-containing protein [Chloroflexi bacterium]|nr:MAG: helix-turn-helix domain-containing protein [Chloroflexota bacterium]
MYPGDIPLHDFPYRHEHDPPIMIKQLNPHEPWMKPAPDRHTFYALFWIAKGEGFHHIDYTRYEIQPQTLYLMRPGQSHFFEVVEKPMGISIFFLEEFLYLNNQFQPTELFYLIDQCPALYLKQSQAVIVTQLIEQLLDEYDSERLGYLDALQHLMQLLLIYVRRFYDQPNTALTQPTSITHLSSQFQRLVDQHFLTIHHLQVYADMLGVTPGYLSEQIKLVTSVPASHIIRRRIVIEAKRLLAHTQLTVSELCLHLGFKDSSYFSRFFRRETGQSPLDFRLTYREKYRNTLG